MVKWLCTSKSDFSVHTCHVHTSVSRPATVALISPKLKELLVLIYSMFIVEVWEGEWKIYFEVCLVQVKNAILHFHDFRSQSRPAK